MPTIILLFVLGASFLSFFLSFKWGLKALYVQVPLGVAAFTAGYFLNNILFFVIPIFLGSFAGYAFKADKSLQFFVLVSALVTSLFYAGNFYYLKHIKGVDMMQSAKHIMIETFNVSDLTAEKKNEMSASLDRAMDFAKKILPFSAFVYSLFSSFLTFFVAKLLLIKVKDLSKIQGMASFRNHDYTIFILIAGIAIMLYFDINVDSITFIIGLNAVLIAAALYFLQAVGVIGFFLSKKGLPLYIIPIFFVLLLFTGINVMIFITIMLAGFGALDMWADFRKVGSTQTK